MPSSKPPLQKPCPSLALVPESTHAVSLNLAEFVVPLPAVIPDSAPEPDSLFLQTASRRIPRPNCISSTQLS